MPTLKYFIPGLVGVILFLSSCTPRYFYASRINYFSFDTCRQAKLVVEPYFNGVSGAIAVSPVNHLAIEADFNSESTSEKSELLGYYGSSSGTQTDFSIGYFDKFNSGWGFDVFAGFGHQYVSCDSFANNNGYPDDGIDINFSREYYMFSLQPSLYFNQTGSAHFALGMKASAVMNNYDTQELQPNYFIIKRHFEFDDILLEPGAEMSTSTNSVFRFGAYAHIPVGGNLGNDKMRYFTFTVKITSRINRKNKYKWLN